jgi:hypothetical protein
MKLPKLDRKQNEGYSLTNPTKKILTKRFKSVIKGITILGVVCALVGLGFPYVL